MTDEIGSKKLIRRILFQDGQRKTNSSELLASSQTGRSPPWLPPGQCLGVHGKPLAKHAKHTLRATPRRYSLLGLRLSANLQADLGKVKQQTQHELKHWTEILQFASLVRCLDMSFEHHRTQQRCTGDTTLETSNHQQGPQPTSPCAKKCSYMLIPSCAKMRNAWCTLLLPDSHKHGTWEGRVPTSGSKHVQTNVKHSWDVFHRSV